MASYYKPDSIPPSCTRRQALAPVLNPCRMEIPTELVLALNLGWPIEPVSVYSRHAFLESHVGKAIVCEEELEEWLGAHPDNNWCVQTGIESGVIALNAQWEIAQASLRLLSRGDRSWFHTLQYMDGTRRNFLFSYRESRPLLDLRQVAGLRLYCGSRILVPPSRVGLERLGRRFLHRGV